MMLQSTEFCDRSQEIAGEAQMCNLLIEVLIWATSFKSQEI